MILKKANILVIDDDADVLTAVRLLLKTEVQQVVTEKNPEIIPSLITSRHFDLVLLDMNFAAAINNGNEGLFWLRRIKGLRPDTFVVMITAYGDIDLAVRSLKEGASDFIVKPWHNEKLLSTIAEILTMKERPAGASGNPPREINAFSDILGRSEAMLDIFTRIEKVAPTDANILILGENGTGKDLVAKALHNKSLRSKQPFVKVDIGALTESLFESELFGHKKGAFTDAMDDRIGRFEEAGGGTLFLDEIGNISLQQQAKLLTALQNRQITRIGTNHPVQVDIRLICATNRPLQELANENHFRKDLIYRINTVEIIMPPLRKRIGDIRLLTEHFVRVYATKYFKSEITLSPVAWQKLEQYHFPGNVRELQYIVERAVIMAESNVLEPDNLIFSPIESSNRQPGDNVDETRLSTLEKNTILRVIEKNNSNITKAAKELGITRTALYRRLHKFEI